MGHTHLLNGANTFHNTILTCSPCQILGGAARVNQHAKLDAKSLTIQPKRGLRTGIAHSQIEIKRREIGEVLYIEPFLGIYIN